MTLGPPRVSTLAPCIAGENAFQSDHPGTVPRTQTSLTIKKASKTLTPLASCKSRLPLVIISRILYILCIQPAPGVNWSWSFSLQGRSRKLCAICFASLMSVSGVPWPFCTIIITSSFAFAFRSNCNFFFLNHIGLTENRSKGLRGVAREKKKTILFGLCPPITF